MKRMKWPVVRLGEIAEFRNGLNYNKGNFGKGLKVINVKDFQDRLIVNLTDLEEINPEGIVREESYIRDGDILFVRSNGNRELIGRSMLVTGVQEPISHSAFSIKARFRSQDVLPRFYAYLFRTALIRSELSNRGGGTNISNLNQDILNCLEVPKPPLSTQRKIAGILSAYDDLIENNTRRITILEEMAQAIYREWFVHFRFPGHEKVKLVDSALGKIPEGWTTKPMGSVLDIRYGKNLPTKQIQTQGQYPVYGAGGIIGYYDSCVYKSKVALVTCRGNGSGTVWRTRQAAYITNNSFYIVPLPAFSDWLFDFIELHLKHSNVAAAISGSAQPQITIDGLSKVEFIVPDIHFIQAFSTHINGISDMIDLFVRKNEVLRQTRDLLLPKLISGQVDVEGLEIT